MKALVEHNGSQLLLECGHKVKQAPRRGMREVKAYVREEDAVR